MPTLKNKSFLPDNYIYISHLDEDFQYWRLPVTPDTISDSMTVTWSPQNALGRSAPVYTYNNSGPRTVGIKLAFRRDMLDDINEGISNVNPLVGDDYTDTLIRALQSIAVPKYNLSDKAIEPAMVALRLGQTVFIKGIVTGSVDVTYSLPILADGKYAGVEIGLTIYETEPYDSEILFQKGSFRGLIKTMKKGMGIEDD